MNFTIHKSFTGNKTIAGKAVGKVTILNHRNIPPDTEILKEKDNYHLTVPLISHAYSIVLSFNKYLMTLVIGSLYTSVPTVSLPTSKNKFSVVSGKIHGDLSWSTEVNFCEGFNNISIPEYTVTTKETGEFEKELPVGLYTVYTNRTGWLSEKRNVVVDSPVTVSFVTFPVELNTGFITVLNSEKNSIFSRFSLNNDNTCFVDLRSPRCGGTRVFYLTIGEILITSDISASYYLIYVRGNSFEKDIVEFYSSGFPFPHFSVYGENKGGVWMVYCLNGREGVNSLRVINSVVSEEEFAKASNICTEFYGNETWSQEELKKGFIVI